MVPFCFGASQASFLLDAPLTGADSRVDHRRAGASPAVAASKTITGYDPVSMQVVCMDTAPHEDSPKGNDAPGQQQTAARSGHAPQGGVASKSSTHRSSKPQWRPKHTPHIGRDELIVVLKPSTTLDLKATFAPGQVGSAVRNLLRECGNVELSVWPVCEQNVIVCGLNSEPAARRLLGDVTLTIGGDVCKGVITIDPNDTSASLKPKLRWKNGEILSVRRLGSSNVAVVIFEGKFVPRQIYYNNQGIPGGYLPETQAGTLRPMRLRGGYHSRGPCRTQMHSRLPHLRWANISPAPLDPGTSPTTDKRKDDFKKNLSKQGKPQDFDPSVGQTCSGQEQHKIGDRGKDADFQRRGLSYLAKRPKRVPNNSWDFGANAAVRAIRAG
ncbi:hypothetical protein HPB48_001696 [Haemaphysalis longicornis]|uniref:Uncharacterized protein n=1 Tax=Haemaphysalis longicornis TaxID=44386 RepID=A0A9J6GK20_HAELO|nr:hypothetical protein HPB48_001696 [Haemaphysalis longicornis]